MCCWTGGALGQISTEPSCLGPLLRERHANLVSFLCQNVKGAGQSVGRGPVWGSGLLSLGPSIEAVTWVNSSCIVADLVLYFLVEFLHWLFVCLLLLLGKRMQCLHMHVSCEASAASGS